jgi:hypothetical protein
MIILGRELEDHSEDFTSCIRKTVSDCKYCMPYEDNMKIFLCKGLKKPLKEIWKQEKHYE